MTRPSDGGQTTAEAPRVSDGNMPCPVPSDSGPPCTKKIPEGWTADMGHGGGHCWMSPKVQQAMERGHYDARAALAGEWFTIHQPEDCTPSCPHWQRDWESQRGPLR